MNKQVKYVMAKVEEEKGEVEELSDEEFQKGEPQQAAPQDPESELKVNHGGVEEDTENRKPENKIEEI